MINCPTARWYAERPCHKMALDPADDDAEGVGPADYQLMFRMPGDPDDGEGGKSDRRKAAHAAGKGGGVLIAEHKALKKAKPEDFADHVERLLHAAIGGDDKPRTMHCIGMELLGKGGDLVVGTALEECVWQLVDAKSLRWGFALAAATFTRTPPRSKLAKRQRDWTRCILFTSWPAGTECNVEGVTYSTARGSRQVDLFGV